MPLVGCPGRFREPSSTVVSHAWTPELVLMFSTHLRGSWRGNDGTPHHSHVSFAPGLIAPVVVVATLCQGRDAHVKMNIKQWTDTSIQGGGRSAGREVYNHNTGKTSVAALLLAEPDLASQERSKVAFKDVSILQILFQMVFKVALQSVVWACSWHLKAVVKGRRSRAICATWGGTGPQGPQSPTEPTKHPRQQHRPPTWLSHQLFIIL